MCPIKQDDAPQSLIINVGIRHRTSLQIGARPYATPLALPSRIKTQIGPSGREPREADSTPHEVAVLLPRRHVMPWQTEKLVCLPSLPIRPVDHDHLGQLRLERVLGDLPDVVGLLSLEVRRLERRGGRAAEVVVDVDLVDSHLARLMKGV